VSEGKSRTGALQGPEGLGLLEEGVKGPLATYVVCAAEDPARCSVGTGRWEGHCEQKGETKNKVTQREY